MDSIRLSSDAERQIDEICAKYDPANNEKLRRYLDRIPNPEDREFVIQYHRDYQRARVEVFYAVRAIREFAMAASDYHRIVLAEITELGLGDLILKDMDNFKEAESELFNRHWKIVEFFERDGDLGDGYGESYFYQRWAAMTEAAGKSLTDGDYGTLAMLLEKIAELEGREG